MYSFSQGFTPLRGDICGFSSTPLTSPVFKRRRKRNRRFSERPIKLKPGDISPRARRAARNKWKSCLVSNSLSIISFLEQTETNESRGLQYSATNELETMSLGQLSYSTLEANFEIMKERVVWLREKAEDNSTEDEESDFSIYFPINHYMDDITYLSEDERYARIDDENISTTDDDSKNNCSTDISVGNEPVFILDNKNHLTDDQMLKWMTKIVIKVT